MAASLSTTKNKTTVDYYNPNCDSIFSIPGAVTAGTEFRFEGTVTKQPKKFGIVFQEKQVEQSEVDVRYDVDVENSQVIIDSKYGRIQHAVEDERQSPFPFEATSAFVISIKTGDTVYELKINEGKTYVYQLQDPNPLRRARCVSIAGDVHVRKVSIMKPALELSTYDLLIPGNVQLGDVYTFVGLASSKDTKIDIQFLNENHPAGDVWFHINAKCDSKGDGTFVRNSRIARVWGQPESTECPQLRPDKQFVLDVVVERDCFRCWVNEEEFCKYMYKHPKSFEDISSILIDKSGNLSNIKIDRASNHLPPQLSIEWSLNLKHADFKLFFPQTPFVKKLSRKMRPGRCIFISGVFKEDAKDFVIALDKGLSQDTVVYECKVFFEQQVVVQSYRNIEWGPEVPVESPFPFSRGSHFHLQLICDQSGGFEITVDGIPSFKAPAHLDCGLVDHVYVVGDVKISLIGCF